jgi:hypothetical protein
MTSVDPDVAQTATNRSGKKLVGGSGGLHRRLIVTIGRYRTVAAWFWRDAYRRFKFKASAILLYNVLSIGFLLGALGSVFFYIRALEKGEPIYFLGYTVLPRESVELLIFVSIAAFFLFMLSFGVRFVGRLQALALGRSYEEFCSKRAIVLLANHGGHPDAAPWVEKAGQAFQGDPRYCGRVARIAVSIVLPVMTFLGTFVLLVVLDAAMTLVILALMLVALPVLYAINLKGARHSVAMEKLATPAGQAKRGLVSIPAKRGGLLEPDSPEVEDAFARGPIARYSYAYVGRLRARDNSEFLTNSLMALGLTVILTIKGVELLYSGEGWSELVAYIMAVRFNLQSMTQASKILTGINRFYPQVARHHRFVHTLEGLSPAPADVTVSLASTGIDDALTDE